MKPFKYLTEVVAADITAICDQWPDAATQIGSGVRSSTAISDLFQSASGAADQVTRGRSWIRLTEVQHGNSLTQETKSFLVSKLHVDATSVTHTVIEAWLDALRLLVDKMRRKDNVTRFQGEYYRKLAGIDWEELERDSSSYVSFLSHINPNRRCAAIIRMVSNGINSTEQLKQLMQMIEQDDDASVQITATRNLIECCFDSLRPEVLALLARVVTKDSMPLAVRDIAYEGLFEVAREPVSDWPITRFCQGRFIFPNDIDWSFVKKCSKPPL